MEYPAASQYVIGVGGTTLSYSGATWTGETAWSGNGGGASVYEPEPGFQSGYPIPSTNGKRVPDVAYDADSNTGFSVYDTVRYQGQSGWFQVGGTSAGAPQWTALFAIANSMRAALSTPKPPLSTTAYAVYAAGQSSYTSNFHDVPPGTNGAAGPFARRQRVMISSPASAALRRIVWFPRWTQHPDIARRFGPPPMLRRQLPSWLEIPLSPLL